MQALKPDFPVPRIQASAYLYVRWLGAFFAGAFVRALILGTALLVLAANSRSRRFALADQSTSASRPRPPSSACTGGTGSGLATMEHRSRYSNP
jgi:hypothetical protein